MTVGAYYGMNYEQNYNDMPNAKTSSSMAGYRISMIDTQEVDTTTGLATCTLTFFKPPAGARIIGGQLWAEAMVSTGTLSVGTGATVYARTAVSSTVPFDSVDWATKTSAIAVVDKFLAATTHNAATKTALLPIATIDLVGYEFDGGTTITVTGATADMVNAARVTLLIDLIIP